MKRKEKSNSVFFVRTVIFILTLIIVAFIASVAFKFLKKAKRIPGDEGIPYTRIEVINGCGVNNLAYKVSLYLREQGFDVVEITNAKQSDVERTVIIERVDEGMKNAKLLGKFINCSNTTTVIDSSLFLEVTLLLGKDYTKFFKKDVLEKKLF